MLDPPPSSDDIGDGIGVAPEGASPPGVPRWVKVVALVALVVALLLLAVALLAGGGHGPGRHAATASNAAPILG